MMLLNYRPVHFERRVPLDRYIEKKIAMLQEEFCISLSLSDIDRFLDCKTHNEVDALSNKIIADRL